MGWRLLQVQSGPAQMRPEDRVVLHDSHVTLDGLCARELRAPRRYEVRTMIDGGTPCAVGSVI